MNKYNYLKVLQGHYHYGWEDIHEVSSKNRIECIHLREDFHAYRENAPEYAYRIITRRELISQEDQQ